jgi:hypothetical protein
MATWDFDFSATVAQIARRNDQLEILEHWLKAARASTSNNELAALLLGETGSYENAMSWVRGMSTLAQNQLVDLAMFVRLEAHERGLIDANNTSAKGGTK